MEHPDRSHRQIELLAYELWNERGCPTGTAETDWFRAEQDFKNARPETGLAELAREVGGALGSVVALVNEKLL